MTSNVDYRLVERFLAAQRRNLDGRYDVDALNRLRSVVELRRDDRRAPARAQGAAVVPLPLDD